MMTSSILGQARPAGAGTAVYYTNQQGMRKGHFWPAGISEHLVSIAFRLRLQRR
jgi:hypothetical protein